MVVIDEDDLEEARELAAVLALVIRCALRHENVIDGGYFGCGICRLSEVLSDHLAKCVGKDQAR